MLAHRLGGQHVTCVDVDAYLAEVAAERLAGIGLSPQLMTCDATGPLPGAYDRIVSTVAVRPIPASWLAALRPGGRIEIGGGLLGYGRHEADRSVSSRSGDEEQRRDPQHHRP